MKNVISWLACIVLLAGCGGGSSSPPTYTVSGTIDHLSSSGLALTNGTTTLSIASGATSFAFPDQLPDGTAFQISVASQPAGENCVVAQSGGVVAAANVSTVDVQCNTAISSPTGLGIYPVATGPDGFSHAYVPVTMVGNVPVSINATVDTGSSGVVLNALDIFPSSMVTVDGFTSPPGVSYPEGIKTVSYNGITVTNIVVQTYLNAEGSGNNGNATSNYTNTPGVFAYGNIGYAQVSFGENGSMTTAVIPVLLVFKTLNPDGAALPSSLTTNIFGINPSIAPFYKEYQRRAPGLQTCDTAPSTSFVCGLVSPLRSLTYASNVDPGYVLKPFSLQTCDIGTPGSCKPVASLQVGVNEAAKVGFTSFDLSCQTLKSLLVGAPSMNICDQTVSPSTLSFAGNSTVTGVIVNTGNSGMIMGTGGVAGFPATIAVGTPISVTMGPSFNYTFTAGTGNFATTVGTPPTLIRPGPTDIGIGFFSTHSMFVDYTAGTEGWL
ncbi:hypothetical protein AWB71_02609 [Caballeronia peredens]|nr:hypothetical protein AWB71_02609 [Caballeronia peredens]